MKIYSLLIFFIIPYLLIAQDKKEINTVESIRVVESNIYFQAFMDPNSDISIINASRIAVMNASTDMNENMGREIVFKVTNEKGEYKTINSRVAGVTKVKTENGEEEKYLVEFTCGINYKNEVFLKKKIKVALVKRENKEQKLLLGKNWLGEEYKVIQK